MASPIQLKQSLEIRPNPISKSDDKWKRSCQLIRKSPFGDIEDNQELWFEFDGELTPPKDEDCDSYLLAAMTLAMTEDRDIQIKGSVCAELLSNLTELQGVWNKWLPYDYQKVKFFPDDIRKAQIPNIKDQAICAFSGGIDSLFSVWTHYKKKQGYRSQNLTSCALIHGFDIPIEQNNTFDKATQRAQEILLDTNLKLFVLKTNFRKIIHTHWDHTVSFALAAALNNYKSIASVAVIGSSNPYSQLVFPIGTSPLTDHLLSSNHFKILHDGAGYNRTEKVAEIADWQEGLDNLRVCWQGDLKDRNCGKCEKCVRTKLNFLANGQPIPDAFESSDIASDIRGVKITNRALRNEWQQIYQAAKKNGIKEDWVSLLLIKVYKPIINKHVLIDALVPKGSKRRQLIQKLLATKKPPTVSQ